MERYNPDFNKLFPCVCPSQFNFCDCLHAEANHWLTQHKDARNGIFTGGQLRREVDWPEVPTDVEGWFPKKRRSRK